MRSVSVSVVSSGPIGVAAVPSTGPASSSRTTRMMLAPASGVAGEDGGGDGRRAAVARQQRGVDVQHAARERVEQVRRQDVRRRGEHAHVRRERGDLRRLLAADALRREHGHARLGGEFAHRRRDGAAGAAARAVGLRDGGDDLDAGRVEQPAQRRDGVSGRAEEDDAHQASARGRAARAVS